MRLGGNTLRGSNPDPPQLAGPLPELAGLGPASRGSPRLQFGLQLYSSLAPQRFAHSLARVPHLECGHVGVALGRRHPRVTKYLLDNADVHALFDSGVSRSRRCLPSSGSIQFRVFER
jgi:hypothetical protein